MKKIYGRRLTTRMFASQQPHPSEEESFANLFEESLKKEEVKKGSIVHGRVIQVTKDYTIVDIGYKSEGYVKNSELPINSDHHLAIKVGDTIEVKVEEPENEEGLCILSYEKAKEQKAWNDVAAAFEQDQLVDGRVTQRVKGGLEVVLQNGVKAFLPGSQVDLRPVRNLENFVGKTFTFKVIKVNKKRENIVLSRRALLERERADMKEQVLGSLIEGQVVDGIVKNLTEYGAFIDLGGIDGLLHITDMSWGRINHPSELFQVGDQIKVKVLKFNSDTERVSLGLKQISEDPWRTAPERYTPGTVVRGKIISLKDYGAFVELEEGIEGLIHVSEMSWTRRIKHPSKMVAIGDTVEAVVLEVDIANNRISLGMKQLEPNPYESILQKYPVGSKVKGIIRNITDFGLFVEIEEGVDGLVHVSDISWTQKIKHPSELYNKGDQIEAMVLQLDTMEGDKPKISLGIKQLVPDPWDRIPFDYPIGKVVSAKVLKVMDFGTFVELEAGVEGLIHVSEMTDDRNKEAGSSLKIGQEVQAEVVSVDPNERKIGLSIRSAQRRADISMAQGYRPNEFSGAKLGDIFAKQKSDKKRRNQENNEE